MFLDIFLEVAVHPVDMAVLADMLDPADMADPADTLDPAATADPVDMADTGPELLVEDTVEITSSVEVIVFSENFLMSAFFFDALSYEHFDQKRP